MRLFSFAQFLSPESHHYSNLLGIWQRAPNTVAPAITKHRLKNCLSLSLYHPFFLSSSSPRASAFDAFQFAQSTQAASCAQDESRDHNHLPISCDICEHCAHSIRFNCTTYELLMVLPVALSFSLSLSD